MELDQLGGAACLIGVKASALFFRKIFAVQMGAKGSVEGLADVGQELG